MWSSPNGWPPIREILFIDEPTNGIDIGAKSEIHNLMRRLASQGMAIVMVSSELPEVLSHFRYCAGDAARTY